MTAYKTEQSIHSPPSPADYVRNRGSCSLGLYEGEKHLMLELAAIEGDDLCRYFYQYDAIVDYLVERVRTHSEFKPGSGESFGVAYSDALQDLGLQEQRVVTLVESLDTGEFNCFTSFLLAFDVAKRLGFSPEAAIAPSHITMRIGSGYMETIDGYMMTEGDILQRPFRETSESATIQALALTNMSLGAEKDGTWEAALQRSSLAIEFDPELPQPHLNRARRYLRMGDVSPALEDIEVAKRLLPGDGGPYSILAIACFLQGDLRGAIQNSGRAIELDPSVPFAHYLRGFFHGQLGEYDSAIREFDKAIALDPSNANGLLFFNLGVARLFNSLPENAITDFTHVLTFDEEDSDALAARRYARSLTGDIKGAVSDWNAALAIDPRLEATAGLMSRIGSHAGKGRKVSLDNETVERLEPWIPMRKDVGFSLAF